jgi:hypothetical protein
MKPHGFPVHKIEFMRKLRSTLTGFMLPLLLLFSSSSDNLAARFKEQSPATRTETVEKLIVARGTATMDVDLNRLNDAGAVTEEPNLETMRFALAPDSFFIDADLNTQRAGNAAPGSVTLSRKPF